jgi:hypothetical protein
MAWAGKMPGPIQLELDQLGHDVKDQLKFGIAVALCNGGLATGKGVIGADHLFAGLHQPISQVGSPRHQRHR